MGPPADARRPRRRGFARREQLVANHRAIREPDYRLEIGDEHVLIEPMPDAKRPRGAFLGLARLDGDRLVDCDPVAALVFRLVDRRRPSRPRRSFAPRRRWRFPRTRSRAAAAHPGSSRPRGSSRGCRSPAPELPTAVAGKSSANSSPPTRATTSESRVRFAIIWATVRRSSSPRAWPSVSLTSLRPSTSIRSSAPSRAWRLATAISRRAAPRSCGGCRGR